MRRYYFIVAASIFYIVLSIIATSHVFASTSTPSLQTQKEHCVGMMVYLHDKYPSTTRCLRTQVSGQVTPFSYTTDCTNRSLALRGHDDWGDLYLCFLGTGFANLTDFTWRVWPFTWNGYANWYGPGCNYGYFYTDINGNGTIQRFVAGTAYNFDGQNGRLMAYTLSSFRIDSSC